MNKLNFFGVGPKIAVVLLPWLAISVILSCFGFEGFMYTLGSTRVLVIAGIATMAIGMTFYFTSLKYLLKGLSETRLVTKGPYSLCQNPLYAAIILLIIPGLSLIMNSWLIATSTLVGYVMMKIHIGNEYQELEKFFGENYLKYKRSTPEFFPFPLNKRR